jgi:phytol kinase
MGLVRHLAGIWGTSAEVQRKLVHISTGLFALTLPWLFPDRWPVYVLIALTLGVMLVLRMPSSRLGSTLHGVKRQSYGDLLLAISVGLCLFLVEDQLFLYVLPIAVLTLADAAAALAGSTYGRRFFTVEDGQKSIEGSVVFFVVTLLIAVVCLLLMTSFPPLNIIVVAVMVAAFGTLVEAASWRGFDNFFLPLGLLVFLSTHAADPLPDLLRLAILFALCIVLFGLIAPRIGLTKHASRVYVIAVFLLLAVTEWQNAVIPILVLASHAWCRSANPSTERFPDLDVVAGLALISFGWLALGNGTDWNAVSFYGVTALGMMVALCAIALSKQSLLARGAALTVIVLAALGLRTQLIAMNAPEANWAGPMWPALLATLALCVLLPLFRPHLFSQSRVMRVTLMALVVPLASYGLAISFSFGPP